MVSTAVKVEDMEGPNAIVKIDPAASSMSVSLLEGPTIPFDDTQASLTKFPPGCSVLHVNSAEQPPSTTTLGVVESVSFHVATKELLYHIVPQDILAAYQGLNHCVGSPITFCTTLCCRGRVRYRIRDDYKGGDCT